MIFKSRLTCAALLLLGTLCGCAATLESEGLKAPKESRQARLDIGTSYRYGGSDNSKFEVGVQAGTFQLELESSAGLYDLADAPSVWWKVGDKLLLLNKAGIWIPRDKSQLPRLYFYNHGGSELIFSSIEEPGSATLASKQSKPLLESGSDVRTQLAVDIALRSTGTPLQTGIGIGLGFGIATAISEYDRNVPSIHPAPPSVAFANHLSTNFVLLDAK